ncbi:LysE family translocator [Thalassotalea sp. PLHSN55]|uniref:LysE family translocator n=1 Tax=Thalassotalea sp. PLHSN55 TaxID=3435888 RepID=UPI003F837053
MLDITLLLLFLPTFFIVSITPGMCMTLAMTLGMTIGVRRTLWMMWGELLGVCFVAIAAVIGVATLMLEWPVLFQVFKYLGGSYLVYIGINMWRSKGKMAINHEQTMNKMVSNKQLFNQGFITAIANPKGWAFMVSLLPPFISANHPFVPQLIALIVIIVITEFSSLMVYATGGKTIGKLLVKSDNVKLLNKLSGTIMVLVGIWLFFS